MYSIETLHSHDNVSRTKICFESYLQMPNCPCFKNHANSVSWQIKGNKSTVKPGPFTSTKGMLRVRL